MKKPIWLLSLCLYLSSCAYFDPAVREVEKIKLERQKELQSINLEDGVNREEANILGSEYFLRYVSGCGVTGEPIDKGDHWEVEMRIGYAALPAEDRIYIDKASGVISLKGYPTIIKLIKEWLGDKATTINLSNGVNKEETVL